VKWRGFRMPGVAGRDKEQYQISVLTIFLLPDPQEIGEPLYTFSPWA
jgi:hypothetical protein